MRIRDLYESDDYKEKLNNEIMNIIMMFMKTGVTEIDIENIIAELEKNDIVATENDVEEFVDSNDNLSVNQEKQVVFSTEGSGDTDEGRPDISDEEEYNPASEKAKEATKKAYEIMYKEKFNYPNVVNESTGDAGRVYFIEMDGKKYDPVYSVTTILSKMSDKKEVIEEWKRTIGHKNAQAILDKSLNFGNCMHDILYHQIVETVDYEKLFKQNFIFKVASDMAKKIWDVGLKDVDEIWGAEVPLFVPNCYAGRTDLVGTYKGVPSIIDFKNSYKDKKEEHMEDYFTQAAAYAVAHDFLFDTNIEQCVILIANSDNIQAKKIIKSGEEFVYYKEKWLNILDEYYKE